MIVQHLVIYRYWMNVGGARLPDCFAAVENVNVDLDFQQTPIGKDLHYSKCRPRQPAAQQKKAFKNCQVIKN